MAAGKKTLDERVDALGVLVGKHDGRLDQVEKDAEAATKTGAAAIALARKVADALKNIQTQQTGTGDEEEPPEPPVCPLVERDLDVTVELLRELSDWLRQVYVRYPDHGLTDCWAYHPWAVTELWALYKTWELYYGEGSNDRGVLDWHIRYRKVIADEVSKGLKGCGLPKHQNVGDYLPPRVDGREMLGEVAHWYTDADPGRAYGGGAPPAPDKNMVALSKERKKRMDARSGGSDSDSLPRP